MPEPPDTDTDIATDTSICERFDLPCADDESAHLSLRFDRPAAGGADGVAVLYLHGFGSSQEGDKATFFRHAMVGAGLAVASIDFRGHGSSGSSLFDISLSRNLDDIGQAMEFLRDRACERFVLFGSSMGAAAALWYAAFHPQDGIEAAIAIAPALDMEARLAERVGEHGLERWQRDGRIALPHEETPVEVSWQLIADLRQYPTDRLASLLAVPTLVFQGRHDTSVDWQSTVRFAAACDHDILQLLLIGDGDHRLIAHKDHLWRLAHSFLIAQELLRDNHSLP